MKNLLKKINYLPRTKSFVLYTSCTAPFFGKSIEQIAYKLSKVCQDVSFPEAIEAIKNLEKVWVSAPNNTHWTREKVETFLKKA